MPPPAFVSLALPRLQSHKHPRNPPCCALPSLSELQSLGVLTLYPRRSHHHPSSFPATAHIEPELIALVGVSHHSSALNRSADFVSSAVTQLRADAVVLELCRMRAPLLNAPPPPLPLPKWCTEWWSSTVPGGQLLSSLLAPSADAPAAGAEFRAAKQAAENVGATLVLGDRPLTHTLARAWGALPVQDRFILARALVTAAVRGEGVESVADAELKETVLSGVGPDGVAGRYVDMLGERFPGLKRTLVEERDLYLAWVLKRSRAVCGKRCVVGVVGKAHVEGVFRAMEEDDKRRTSGDKPLLVFRDLVS